MSRYTDILESRKYTTQYPKIYPFDIPLRRIKQVAAGAAGFETKEPQYTDGISECHVCLVWGDQLPVPYVLVHMRPLSYTGEYLDQKETLKQLPGKKRAIRYTGTYGRSLGGSSELCTVLDIDIVETVKIDTGNEGWALLYSPELNLVYLDQRYKQTILTVRGL